MIPARSRVNCYLVYLSYYFTILSLLYSCVWSHKRLSGLPYPTHYNMAYRCNECSTTFRSISSREIHLNETSHELRSIAPVTVKHNINILPEPINCPVCSTRVAFDNLANHFNVWHCKRYKLSIVCYCDICNIPVDLSRANSHKHRPRSCRDDASSNNSENLQPSPPKSTKSRASDTIPKSPPSLRIVDSEDEIILTQGDLPEMFPPEEHQPMLSQFLHDQSTIPQSPPPSPTLPPTIHIRPTAADFFHPPKSPSPPPSPTLPPPADLSGTRIMNHIRSNLGQAVPQPVHPSSVPSPPHPVLNPECLPLITTSPVSLPSSPPPPSPRPPPSPPSPHPPPVIEDLSPDDDPPSISPPRPDASHNDPDIPHDPNPDIEDLPEFTQIWMGRIASTSTFPEFEDMCSRFATAARDEGRIRASQRQTKRRSAQPRPQDRPPARAPPSNRRILTFNPIEARRLQTFYRLSRKRAMRTIVADNNIQYTGSSADATTYFTETHSEKPIDTDLLIETLGKYVPSAKPDVDFLEPFADFTIAQKLRSMANSAPGKDKLEYNHLKLVDPEAKVLQLIYNRCLLAQRIPASWKEATTILIHKKGPSDDPSNFRPIALMSCLYKLYAALLTTRISRTALEHGLLSPNQKSARPGEGCHEHTFTLLSLISDCKRSSKNAFIAWLDLRNAFGSIPHDALYITLSHMGFPPNLICIIRDIYTDASTAVRTSATEFTSAIPILAGVKQGCPLSAILFNLTSELLIRVVEHAATINPQHPFSLHKQKISALAYADDLVLVSRTREGLQEFLDHVSDAADILSLDFRPDKCATLSATCNKREPARVSDTVFRIQDTEIPVLTDHEPYRYLGVPVNLIYNSQDMTGITSRLERDLIKIKESLLAPWQKLDAIRTFIQPCLTYILRAYPVYQSTLKNYRKTLISTLRSICHLPKHATSSYFFASRQVGGLGLQDPFQERHIQTIVQTVKMLSSTDPLITSIARAQLTSCTRRCVQQEPTSSEIDDFLSGSTDGPFARHQNSNNSATLWSRARVAARALNIRFVNATSEEPGFKTDQDNLITAKGASYQLHLYCQTLNATLFKSKVDQGKVARALEGDKFATGSGWQFDGLGIRFCDWRFIHRARTNTLPLNAVKSRWSDTNPACRRCLGQQREETLPHVLCHCRPNMVMIRQRHNKIAQRLNHAIYRGEKVMDLTVPESEDQLRPDIVVRDENRVTIIDITCPFENDKDSLHTAALRKIEKYSPLIDTFAAQGKEAKVFAFVVGALGGWYPGNELLLNELRISHRYRRLMRKLCSADAIQGSRDIYLHHLTNGRQ